MMNEFDAMNNRMSRRALLGRSARGVGGLALASMLGQTLTRSVPAAEATSPADRWTGIVNPLHFAPRAKRVIWLYMAGGMSHLETFDHKPKLAEMHGKPMPESITAGQQIAQLQGHRPP